MSSATTAPKRRYSSRRRAAQAAQTRSDILEAAVRVFAENGWSGSTLSLIAGEADVAVETIYSGFGSKKALLREALDVAVVGDTEQIPLAERPEYQLMGAGTRDERIDAAIRMVTAIHARTARIWSAMRDAAAGDAEVAQWVAEIDERRRMETARGLVMVFEREIDGPLLDLLWAYLGPEIYQRLVHDRGWSEETYREWITRSVLAVADAS